MSFIKFSKFFLALSAVMVIASLALLFKPGIKLSIDFTGGTLMEFGFREEIPKENLIDALKNFQPDAGKESLANASVNVTRQGTFLVKTRFIEPQEHEKLLTALGALGEFEETQFTIIGSRVGETMKERAVIALIVASAAIVCYIALVFRKIPKKLSPWRFGVVAVIALLHDILITIGVFIIISRFTSFEADLLFVTALLTILGYSVNDTIIIFDRIRDNLASQSRGESFAQIAGRSVKESLVRSFNTSFTTLFMIGSLYFMGSESIRWFALTLVVGIAVGTYSSICLAPPLLVLWKKRN